MLFLIYLFFIYFIIHEYNCVFIFLINLFVSRPFSEPAEREKNPEDEVNEYLMKAIDARSIDRLRTEHCRTLLLNFRDPNKERKVRFGRIKYKNKYRLVLLKEYNLF